MKFSIYLSSCIKNLHITYSINGIIKRHTIAEETVNKTDKNCTADKYSLKKIAAFKLLILRFKL